MKNELYKDKLGILAEDEILLTAIREVFMGVIESRSPRVFLEDSNELLGERYRAYEESKKILEQGFVDLRSYKVNKPEIKSFNKGR